MKKRSKQSRSGFTPTPMRIGVSSRSKRGFTLIEIMVVISILGFLSAIVLGALSSARVKARDTQRIQALAEIRKALTLYYDANGEKFPVPANYAATGATGGPSNTGASVYISYTPATWSDPGSLGAALAPYIPSMPVDPVNTATSYNSIWGPSSTVYGYGYRVFNDGSDYDLITRFETNNLLQCSVRKYISHAGSTNTATNYGKGWCSVINGTNINATPYLYDDH